MQEGLGAVPHLFDPEDNLKEEDEARPKREFGFSRCTLIEDDITSLYLEYEIDPNFYCLYTIPPLARMSTHYTPLLVAYFKVGVCLLLDTTFVDILTYARIQFGQLHLNATRTIMTLIVLCCHLGVVFTANILSLFYIPIRQIGTTLSIRPRKNRMLLFKHSPNKVD